MALQKQYLYKISRKGIFLGVLQNVISDFSFSQNINSGGTSLACRVALNAFTATDSVDVLITESGEELITESGENITTERTNDLVGNSNSLSLIRSYNDIEVYEFSPNNPNGKIVFKGYISKWKASFGGSNIVDFTVVSNGAELDNYLILGSQTVDASQASSNATLVTGSYGKDGNTAVVVQSFVVGSGITNHSGMDWKVSGVAPTDIGKTLIYSLHASLADAEAGTNSLGSTTGTIQSQTATVQRFSLSSAAVVTPGGTYYGRLCAQTGVITNWQLEYQNTDLYASGQAYYSDGSVGGGGGGAWTTLNYDFYFRTYYTAGATSAPYTSSDSGTILKSIIDSYFSRGGVINYGTGTVDLPTTSVSYTFKFNTILEGIKKCLELAPSDWYFYVDPATNTLYFKETGTTADHRMILGRHIQELDVEANVEQLKNVVYISGGDVGGGINLFSSKTDTASLAANKVGLGRISDNRVTIQATADALMQNFLDTNSDEQYNTMITVLETTYDITLFQLGQNIAFGGFGNFVDQLMLQIVGIIRYPDYVQLKLGVLPRRVTATLEQIIQDLNDIHSLANPSAPS